MKEYVIGIQVIKVYHVAIKARSEQAAINKSYQMPTELIEEEGELIEIETDYATIVK